MSPKLQAKQEKLFGILRSMDRVLVAFSGGTDSAYLAWAANEVLGHRALAVTADSASIPESHKRDAEEFVRDFTISHRYIVFPVFVRSVQPRFRPAGSVQLDNADIRKTCF
jgi:uncharacterized protein